MHKRLRVEFRTTRPSKIFNYSYAFLLSEAESRLLRINEVGCLLAQCSVPNVIFNFAFPVYQRS